MAADAALARRLLNELPPDWLRHDDARPHVLVLGGGGLAAEVCKALLRLCHFRHGQPLRITVAGQVEVPGAERVGELRQVTDPAQAEGPPVCAIYACQDWDFQALAHRFTGFPPPLNLLKAADSPFPLTRALGASPGPDTGEAIARAIHALYLQEQLARGRRPGEWATLRPWDELSESDRNGNRYLADHIRLKLREVGCFEAEGGGGLELGERELDELARAEHQRWAAVRHLDGWRYGSPRDDARKLHPDLVPFDALSQAIQDLDRMAVRAADAYLAQAGLAVLRGAPIALSGTDDPPAPGFAAGARRLLAELRQHYPDRRLVLRTTLATALERAFCEQALEAGCALWAMVADAPPAQVAWPLLARAQRIQVCPEPQARLTAGTRLRLALGARRREEGRQLVLDAAGRVLARPWEPA